MRGRSLLRAEAVGSWRIEGVASASGGIACAQGVHVHSGDPRYRVAVDTLDNVDAIESAIARATEAPIFGLHRQLRVHRVLMERSPLCAETLSTAIRGRMADVWPLTCPDPCRNWRQYHLWAHLRPRSPSVPTAIIVRRHGRS